ncbi:hypothetical protein [Zooshikella ganghwensis]|uniref:hypothetical protein n=1 Tax=Zooshikella ganghwensis TaxID=202772 RepID=UPI0003F82A2E|nr:hypothetical protein [Zooshikella ganghwensis]
MKTTKLAYCLLVPAVCLVPPIQAAIKTYHYDQNARLTNSLKNNLASHDYVYDSVGNPLIKYTLPQQSSYTAPELEITYSEELNKPINPAHPTFSWDIDETTSPVLYDLYFGEKNPPSIYKKNLTLSEIEAEYLKPKTKYFWKVMARDHHNQVIAETETVELTTLNNPPNKPVLVAFDKHKNTLSWKLPEQDPDPNVKIVAYDVYLSEVGKPLELIAENITNTSIELTTTIKPNTGYQWSVVAIDNQGLKSEMAKTGVFQWLDFEIDYLGDYYWHYQGSSRWERAEGKGKGRGTALATTKIVDDQQVAISTTVYSAGGLVSFDVATSSENSHWLRFYIDGEKVGEWSGRKNYRHVEFLVTAGHHELKWVYQKESDAVRGENSIWLDNLVIPALPDSDNDGVADDWEYTYFDSLDTDFKTYDATLDTDQDGVTDLDEAKGLTNPNAKDTDKDGMPDGWEITNRLNPLVVDNNGDIDSNGQNNLSDYLLSVEDYPTDIDTDKDGMPDSWEVAHGLNPAVKDNKEDADSDDRLNEEEYVAGTDPQDSSSVASKTLIDFEDDTLGGYSWRYEGDNQWQRQAEKGKDGSTAQAATGIGVRGYMAFSTVVNAEGGLVSFDVATRTDSYDELSFHIDGQKVGEWSGRKDYHHAEFLVTAGRHELRWVYQKESDAVREDTVWIDNLVIPGLPDSDNDGVIDAWEYTYFDSLDTDFKTYDATLDTDQDGVTDLDEAKAFTNPKAKDTDKDGMPDVWEVANRLNPIVVDNKEDADNDGSLNEEEYIAGTDPQDDSSSGASKILIDFEDDTLGGYFWRYEGDARWERAEGKGTDNSTAWSTGTGHFQYRAVSTIIYSQGGLLSFDASVAGLLYFSIDGEIVGQWNGTTGYHHAEFLLPAGHHELEWVFKKNYPPREDGSAWIDNLSIPGQVDHDQDGVVDGWEYTYFGSLDTDFKTYDATLDTDQDGVTDINEAKALTNPKAKDTDKDGMPDGWELAHGSSALVSDASGDADSDGQNNLLEYILSVEDYPADIDTDKDGMPDRWEAANGLNPVVVDNKEDADNDGSLNEEEYIAGTDPQDDSSSGASKVLIDFEDDTLGGYFWHYEGDARWERAEGKGTDNSTAWSATGIKSGQEMKVSTVIHSLGGLVSFDVAASSYKYGEVLHFYIDGEVVGEWSGTTDYLHAEFLVPEGRHKLTWRYIAQYYDMDYRAENAIWIDNLSIPGQVDHDQDGVVDGWEYTYFGSLDTDFKTYDATLDTDQDGITDLDEYHAGTNPKANDTDNDGMPDNWEVKNHTQPLISDAAQDSNNNGVDNFSDYVLSTENYSPTADFDEDNMPDLWEATHHLKPTIQDAMDDADKDGALNIEEYITHTDPQDNSQYRRILIDFEDDSTRGYYWAHSGHSLFTIGWQDRLELSTGLEDESKVWLGPSLNKGEKASVKTKINLTQPGVLLFELTKYGNSTLKLFIDNKMEKRWRGYYDTPFNEIFSVKIPAGLHTIKFEVEQPFDGAEPEGYVELDNIIIPVLPDTDSDSVADGWEYYYFSRLDADLSQDSDEDGVSDLDEYHAGTNPRDDKPTWFFDLQYF